MPVHKKCQDGDYYVCFVHIYSICSIVYYIEYYIADRKRIICERSATISKMEVS